MIKYGLIFCLFTSSAVCVANTDIEAERMTFLKRLLHYDIRDKYCYNRIKYFEQVKKNNPLDATTFLAAIVQIQYGAMRRDINNEVQTDLAPDANRLFANNTKILHEVFSFPYLRD